MRTVQGVDDAVHVVQGQGVQDSVTGGPLPRGHQTVHLR
jgi:hypothetical protein